MAPKGLSWHLCGTHGMSLSVFLLGEENSCDMQKEMP